MSTATADESHIPRPILLGIGALLAVTLLFVGAARLTGTPPSAAPAVVEADIRHQVVLVTDPAGGTTALSPDGAPLTRLEPGKDGFVRGVLRALHRIRSRSGVALDAPVEIVRWADGRHSLIDPATGWRVELKGFGPDNLQTFASLLSEVAKESPR